MWSQVQSRNSQPFSTALEIDKHSWICEVEAMLATTCALNLDMWVWEWNLWIIKQDYSSSQHSYYKNIPFYSPAEIVQEQEHPWAETIREPSQAITFGWAEVYSSCWRTQISTLPCRPPSSGRQWAEPGQELCHSLPDRAARPGIPPSLEPGNTAVHSGTGSHQWAPYIDSYPNTDNSF